MESITSTIKNAIYGDSTSSDKPATTDVEDRQSHQRGAQSATGDVTSDEPTSTKYNAPQHSTPMRHDASDINTTSYGEGGDSGFGTPSFDKPSGTAAAFPPTGPSNIDSKNTPMPGEYTSPKTEKDGFGGSLDTKTGAPELNTLSASKPDNYDGSSTASLTSKPTDTGILSSSADDFSSSREATTPGMAGAGAGEFASSSNQLGGGSTTYKPIDVDIPSSSVDAFSASRDISTPDMTGAGAGEFTSSSNELGGSATSKPTDMGISGSSADDFSSSRDVRVPAMAGAGAGEFASSSNEFGGDSATSKPMDTGISSTRGDELSPSRTDDFRHSSTPGIAGAGTSEFASSSNKLGGGDSAISLTSRPHDIESEPRGPTDNLGAKDTSKAPAEGIAQGENITGIGEDQQRPNVSSANEPTADTTVGKGGNAMSTSNPIPNSVTGATGSGPGTAVEPSVGADPASGAQPTQKQQGGDRPLEDPKDSPSSAPSGPPPATSSAGGDDGPQKESKGEGTGEKYVKSSGMAADGGDFDATKPGAGREADRLLEEKGIHHTPDPKHDDGADEGESQTGSGKGTGKVSTKEKIKEKLHIGHRK